MGFLSSLVSGVSDVASAAFPEFSPVIQAAGSAVSGLVGGSSSPAPAAAPPPAGQIASYNPTSGTAGPALFSQSPPQQPPAMPGAVSPSGGQPPAMPVAMPATGQPPVSGYAPPTMQNAAPAAPAYGPQMPSQAPGSAF